MKRFTLLSALLCFSLSGAPVAHAQSDGDGDGVVDGLDLCPTEDASFFDADGDGCVDPTAHARHLEYWAAADLPLVYVIHENGAPGISDGSDVVAIIAGFDAWTAIAGVSLSATYGGPTAQSAGSGLDGVNLVSFEDPDFVALFGNTVIAVGVATSFEAADTFDGQPVRPGQIVDADLLFNPNRTFTTDGLGQGVDLQAVATHEAGHVYGLNHSAIPAATMFPALPSGINARSLETDDELLAFMSYPEAGALANATQVRGSVISGNDLSPVPGAAVFAIPSGSEDPLAVQFTLPDGSWSFAGLPAGPYSFYVHPLDGTAGVSGVVPGYINELINDTAVTLFLPEFYDSAESATDDPTARAEITLAAGVTVSGIDVITNVDAAPPVVLAVTPEAGEAGVNAEGVLLVRFDEPIEFASVPSRFALEKVEGLTRTAVGGQLVALADRDVLVFTPSGRLDFDADYELTLSPGILDRFGNATPTPTISNFSVESKPPLDVISIEPYYVVAGTIAVVAGVGFDETDPANNTVSFAGIPAVGLSASYNRLAVVVPDGIPLGAFEVVVTTTTETAVTLLEAVGTEVVDFPRGSPLDSITLQGDPNSIAVLPDARWAIAATGFGVEAVLVDGGSSGFGTTVARDIPGGLDDLEVVAGGTRAYAVNRSGRLLRSLNTNDGGTPLTPPSTFLVPEVDVPTGDAPVGLSIDPAARRAYVATETGRIQKWDIVLGSGTFHQQVGEIDTERSGLRGAMAVDGLGNRILALTPGALLIFDLDTDALLAEIAIGSDPRDVSLAPQGTLAYVTDADGSMRVVSMQNYIVTQVIDTDASLRGLALSPTGGLAYATDRRDDQIAVVDLRESQASFRTVVAELEVGADPVDVVVAPDGLRTFSVHEGSRALEILGIGFGPELSVPYPAYAKPGDLVAFGGSGFAAYDSTLGFTSAPLLDFAGIVVGPAPTGNPNNEIGARNDGAWGRVPYQFTGGPIRLGNTGAAAPGQPLINYSNPTFLDLFTQEDLDATRAPLIFARTFGNDLDLPWQDQSIGLNNVVHPRGDFMLVEVGNEFYAVGLDDTRSDFLKSRGVISNQDGRFGTYRVFTPDGKLLYTQGQNIVRYLDMDPSSPGFGNELGRVDFSTIETQEYIEEAGQLGAIAISPDGSALIVHVGLTGTLYRVPLHGQQANRAVESTLLAINPPRRIQFHPAGEWIYCVSLDSESMWVIPFDTARDDYLDPFQIQFPDVALEDIAISPDGSRLFAVVRSGGLGGSWDIILYDLTRPDNPTAIVSQVLQEGSPVDVATIRLHPNGLRAVVTVPEVRMAHLDVSFAYQPPQQITGFFTDLGDVTGLGLFRNVAEFTPDGRRLLVSEQTNTVVEIYDYASFGSPAPALISGNEQTGVAGTTLPAPVRFRSTDEAGNGVADLIVSVRVTSGGGTIDGGVTSRNYVTDADGYLAVNWTLGPVPDPTPGVATNRLQVEGPGLFITPTAFSVPSPESIPLALVQLLPADGTAAVGVTTTVQAVFSRSVDRSTIDASVVSLRNASTGDPVPTVIGFADLDRRVTLLPLAPLDYSTAYVLEVTTAVADLDGNPLPSGAQANFSTIAPPPATLNAISAPAASVGTQVTLVGAGFDPLDVNNVINFNGSTYKPSSASVDQLRFVVPTAAVTGPLTVTVGSVTTAARTLTVLQPVVDPIDEISDEIELGLVTQGLAVLPDGSRGYSVVREDDQVIPLDLLALTSGTPIDVGDEPVAAVSNPTGDRVYVANFGSSSLSVIDTAIDAVVQTIALPAPPTLVLMSPDGDQVFAITPADSSVHIVDGNVSSATYNTVVTSIPAGRGISAAAVSPDGTRLYLGTDDGFLVIGLTPTDFGVVTSIPAGRGISAAAVSPDGGLLILITDTDEILIVDVSPGSSFGVVTSIPAGRGISAAAVSPDGGLLYLLEEETDEIVVYTIDVAGTVSVLDDGVLPLIVTLTEVTRIDAGDDPAWIAFDPTDPRVSFVGAAGDRTINVFGRVVGTTETCDSQLVLYDPEYPFTAHYITARLGFPAGFDPSDLDVASVRINGVIGAVASQGIDLKDTDGDGVQEALIRFNREDWQNEIPVGLDVPICFTGSIAGVPFECCTVVDNLRPDVLAPAEGDMLMSGVQTTVLWQSPVQAQVDYVLVYFSPNDGLGGLTLQGGPLSDTGSYKWWVPNLPTDRGRVLVVLFNVDKEPIGATVTARFGVDTHPVAVAMQDVRLSAENGDAVVRWVTPLSRGTLDGFRVWRSVEGAEFEPIGSVSYEEARAVEASADFSFVDTDVVANVDYAYVLEEWREDPAAGEGYRHGPYALRFSVQNSLEQNVPNAFNPRTAIRFSVAQEGRTRLVVYDLRGRVVRTLVDEVLRADVYTHVWDGTDNRGSQVSTGVYLYRLETEGFVASRKMTLLR